MSNGRMQETSTKKNNAKVMVPQFRQEEILDSLSKQEAVSLEALSEQLGVSVSTVRRDVVKMVEARNVEMLRGGIVRLQKRRVDMLASLNHANLATEKETIAKRAVELVEEGDIIFIDSGTTTSAMGKYLGDKKITVVTTSTALLKYLPLPNINLILIGGEVVYERECVCGTIAEKELSSMYFDKAFISISGFTDEGVYANDLREGRNKELVKERSHTVYLLADNTKRNRWGFLKFMDPSEGILITEDNELRLPDEA